MPPTQTDLRSLRPPPQPWVPPYHRASVDRKIKFIRWAFFTFFVLLVVYPSAKALGSSPSSSVLSFPQDSSSSHAFSSSPDSSSPHGSAYHIDEAVKQKGNGVGILKPGGAGLVEGLLGNGGRGLAARRVEPILNKNVNISNEHVSVKYWVPSWDEDKLPLSAELEKLILNYSEKLIMVLKDWSGPRITQYLGVGWVHQNDLQWSCKNNLSTCLPPAHKDCFAQMDTITLDFNKKLQEHSIDHYLGMQITLIDEDFLDGESPDMSLGDLYSSLMNGEYSEAYKSKDKKDFQKYVDSRLPGDVEWFLKRQPLWEFSPKDFDAMKRRLEYQMNGSLFFQNFAPSKWHPMISVVKPRQSKNKDLLKGHKGQIGRMIESDGFLVDGLVEKYPDYLPWGPAREEAKEEVEEAINGTRTRNFMAPLRKQCPFWTDCSIEDMEKIAAQHQARVVRFTPLMQHGSPSKSWLDFDKYIEDSAKSLESVAPMIKLTWPIVEKINWDGQIERGITETTAAIEKFCSQLDFCNQKDKETAVGNLQAKYKKAMDLVPSQEVGHLTKRAPIGASWQSWSDFDKDIEDSVKYYQSIAPLWQNENPGLGKKKWDEQMETLVHQTTDAIGQFCLRLPDCTEKDVENAVQKAETKLRSLKTLIQSRDVDLLATRELSKDEWAEFHKQTEIFGKSMDDLARKLATLDPSNLPQLGRETFDQQAGDLISSNAEHFREKCLGTSGCTEPDVITMVQSMKDRIQKSSDLIPSPASPPIVRDLSSEEWTSVDGRIEAFGKSADNLAHKLAASGAPGARKAFDQTVDEWIRVIYQGTQEQCLAIEGCNDQDLAVITQKMRDRASRSAGVIHSRDASTDAFNQQLEEFGTKADNLARGLDRMGFPRSMFDALADQILFVAEKLAQDQCIPEGGCDELVMATRHQILKDRAQQSANLLHSREVSISLLSRDLSKEKWAEFDREIESFGKQLDDQVQNPDQDKLPLTKEFLESMAEQLSRTAIDDQQECPENQGCDEKVLETIKQKLLDRIHKSTSLVHSLELPASIVSRELSEDLWTVIDQFVNNFGETTDRYARGAQSRTKFEEQVKDWTDYRLRDMEENCPRIEGCDEQVLTIITQKYRERAQESVNLIHARELPVSAKRSFPLAVMAETDRRLDEFQKAANERPETESWDSCRDWSYTQSGPILKSLERFGCTAGDDLKEFHRVVSKMPKWKGYDKSARGIHGEDKAQYDLVQQLRNWYRLAKRNYPLEFSAGMDQTMEMANKIFNVVLPIIREFRLDKEYAERALKFVAELVTEHSLRSCMELSYYTEQDVKMFSAEFEVKVHEFLGLMDWESAGKRQSSEYHPARRDLPVNFTMVFKERITITHNIFSAAISFFYEVAHLNLGGSPGLDGEKSMPNILHIVARTTNAIMEDSLKECEERPKDCPAEEFEKFAERHVEETQQFTAALASVAVEKRSDGLLIPFLDLKGPPSLTEGSIPADKRDSPKKISEIMDDDIAATRKILDAVFPVAQEFGAEQTETVLLWIERMMIDRMIELCKEEKECTLDDGDLKNFWERYHKLLEEFQNSVHSGEGPYVDEFVGPGQLDKRDKILDIMNSMSFVTYEPEKNDTSLLGIVRYRLEEEEENIERCKKVGEKHCGMQFTLALTTPEGSLWSANDDMAAPFPGFGKDLQRQWDKLCKNSKVNACLSAWEIQVSRQLVLYIALDAREHQIKSKGDIGGDVPNKTSEFPHELPEVARTLSQLLRAQEITNDTMSAAQTLKLDRDILQSVKSAWEKFPQSPTTINHRADDTSTGMKDFQEFAELDQAAEQGKNQTAIEVDCKTKSTEEDCIPKPDLTPIPDKQTEETPEKNDFVTTFTNWLPFIALFSIISLLLLLLGLKCCTIWSRNRRLVPDESDESPTLTKATSQPLLGPATRPDDEEAQMSQIREPVAPMGLDGASEGWARKWISSKRGDEMSVSKRTSPDASSPHLLPKPPARGPPARAPRIPSLQLPKAIFHTVRAASGLGSPVETEIQKRRVKWGSTL